MCKSRLKKKNVLFCEKFIETVDPYKLTVKCTVYTFYSFLSERFHHYTLCQFLHKHTVKSTQNSNRNVRGKQRLNTRLENFT